MSSITVVLIWRVFIYNNTDAEGSAGEYNDEVFLHGKGKNGYSIFARKGYGELLIRQLELCNKELLNLKRECESYRLVESIDGFVNRLMRLYATLADYLEEQEEQDGGHGGPNYVTPKLLPSMVG